MTELLQRVLQYRVSVAALIEIGLWLALPYLLVGLGWAALHPEQVSRIQTRAETVLPVGADVTAFGLAAALWPASVSLSIVGACPSH
jgi:hypothetical protein